MGEPSTQLVGAVACNMNSLLNVSVERVVTGTTVRQPTKVISTEIRTVIIWIDILILFPGLDTQQRTAPL